MTLFDKISLGKTNKEILQRTGRAAPAKSQIFSYNSATDNAITQLGMQGKLAQHGVSGSQPLISKALCNLEITRRRRSLIPYKHNSLRLLNAK